ncbi:MULTISPECIES: ATP-binding protein [Brevundimonas]|uniref:ATP-binding protein n=1 Tax=Brevundimonas nasdae TaxID=172043 RepID=A0ABX8THP1_9CAUL|nr:MULTISPECIES: ATP-binding protein [Brevundimonas]QYC09613.1 ATP-binding protein [Brevundimonas nasdae]QYC15662.1 ATP-binding protein [Brevundimonas nasdae]
MSGDDRKRAIGKLTSVAADRFVVEMHAGTDNFTVVGFDDIHYVARLGSFLMVPTHGDLVVVEVVGLRERDSASGGDRGEMDKASSAKFLDVVPVGMLPADGSKFRFGVSVFPSLYADVLYALDAELDRIFETAGFDEPAAGIGDAPCVPEGATRHRILNIGRSVVFDNYGVKVRLDDFFGGHAAVLGNTGSGKSCTVASILQGLFEKPKEHHARGATFVVFDVNGEYEAALKSIEASGGLGCQYLVLDGTATPGRFRLPHWFLDQSEWELLLQASERTQVPILRLALGFTTLFSGPPGALVEVRNHILAKCITQILSDETTSPSKADRIQGILQRFNTPQINNGVIEKYIRVGFGSIANVIALSKFLTEDNPFIIEGFNLPAYTNEAFEFSILSKAMDLALLYEEAHGNRHIRDYCSQMVTRLKSLEDRQEYKFLRHGLADAANPDNSEPAVLAKLLGLTKKGEGFAKSHQVIIIDMNSVDDEVVELVSAVLARMTFRLLRHADPRNRFPVHMVLEEAHRYVGSVPSRYAVDASKVFERIAKEGRKYGMFLLVASQRPSELSKTVLSQCANFVIHRIQNPDDLSQIRQMTPFISDAVLKRLPSLPKQHALVFGTSVNLPTTFKVREASPLPHSDDTRIVDLWFQEAGRPANIKIA